MKRKFLEADENCSFLNRRDRSLFERVKQENSTRGPAHDKTKRLNDLWMWLSISPLACTQLRGLLPPSGGWWDIIQQDVAMIWIITIQSIGLVKFVTITVRVIFSLCRCDGQFVCSIVWKVKSCYTLYWIQYKPIQLVSLNLFLL